MYITGPEPISTAYFINPSHQNVCLHVYPLPLLGNGSIDTFTRQPIHATIEDCRRRRFLYGPCRMKGESMGLFVCPLIVAKQRLGKDFPAATKNCCGSRFLCGPCRIKGTCAISSHQNFLLSYHVPLL
jgi:hypothetical protein